VNLIQLISFIVFESDIASFLFFVLHNLGRGGERREGERRRGDRREERRGERRIGERERGGG
jgi:hypothetical protein